MRAILIFEDGTRQEVLLPPELEGRATIEVGLPRKGSVVALTGPEASHERQLCAEHVRLLRSGDEGGVPVYRQL